MTGNLADVKLTIPKLQGENLAGQVNTTLHEEMHLMDLYGRKDPSKSGNWFSTSRTALMDVFKSTSDSIRGCSRTKDTAHRRTLADFMNHGDDAVDVPPFEGAGFHKQMCIRDRC